MADEEAFFVVVGVDEPAGDFVGVAGADFAGLGVEDIDAVDDDLDFVVFYGGDVDVGFAENDEEVGFVGLLEVGGHVEVGVHPGFEDGEPAEFVEVGGAGVVVEGAGDEYVEACISGFAGGGGEVFAGDGAVFGADEDSGSLRWDVRCWDVRCWGVGR